MYLSQYQEYVLQFPSLADGQQKKQEKHGHFQNQYWCEAKDLWILQQSRKAVLSDDILETARKH